MGRKGKNTQNGIMDRPSFQEGENYPTQENGLPAARFQNETQTAVASQTNTNGKDFINGGKSTGAESIVARSATAVKKKMSVKPVSDTELEAGKIVGGVPLGDTAATMSVAGAPAAGISNDQSRVPYSQGGVRANERYGKKISTDNFIINNVVCEQINPSFDEPKDLRESPDAVQGYNGRKQFKSARGKKLYGDHPGATLYERSIDFAGHSAAVHVTGQVIADIDQRSGYPVRPDDANFADLHKGNFLLNGLNITVADGHITGITVDETEIVVPAAAEATEQANMNWQVDANNVAKAIVKMQTELGRETTDKWSPLGYVIDQPYEFGMLFHDGEAITGALTGASYKTAAHSLSFLQNKMAKEGVRGISSIAEWMGEDIQLAANQQVYENAQANDLFSQANCRRGLATGIIAMFDSTGKYANKADFINQPRSLKFHLQTVDNNINPFHAKKEFYKALDKAFLFSTDDGSYNPVLPIHVTDEVKYITPYSLNAWLRGWQNPHVTPTVDVPNHGSFYRETGITVGCNYEYADLRNHYSWEYVDPFIAGLCRWLLRHEANIVKAFGNGVIRMPIHGTNTTANLFSFMVCSAAQDIAWMRNVIFRDYLFAGEQGVYVWEDLASLSEINPVYASQYTYSDYGSALKLGSLSDVAKIRLYWPEIIMPREAYYGDATGSGLENTATVSYYLPFYFNENAINPANASGIDADNGAVMSFPIIRNGVNHEFVDVLYSMSERDVRLCLDRMVTTPVLTTLGEGVLTGVLAGNQPHYSALRYDANSDGRVIATMLPGANQMHGYREGAYLATPRELGFLFPLPRSYGKGYYVANASYAAITDPYITGSTANYITAYQASGNIQHGTVIDRSTSLSQQWIRCFADPLCMAGNNEFVVRTGIIPALSCVYDTTFKEQGADVTTTYDLVNANLFAVPAVYELRSGTLERVNGISNANPTFVGNNTVFSMARMIWTLLQRMYSPINPFEAAWADIGGQNPQTQAIVGTGVDTDPLEFAIYFGCAGTLGSDFNQDILDRLNKKDELGGGPTRTHPELGS